MKIVKWNTSRINLQPQLKLNDLVFRNITEVGEDQHRNKTEKIIM